MSSATAQQRVNHCAAVASFTELLTAQLQLNIAKSGTNVMVSWPALATGYQLQSATNLVSAGWSGVTQTLSTNGSQLSVLVPVSGGQKFFRLKKL